MSRLLGERLLGAIPYTRRTRRDGSVTIFFRDRRRRRVAVVTFTDRYEAARIRPNRSVTLACIDGASVRDARIVL